MTRRQCPSGCDAEPPRGVILCNACRRRLEGYLADCESLRQELTITLARQDNIGPEAEATKHLKASEQGMPFNAAASDALDALKATLVSWVLLVSDETGADVPADRIAALSSWLVVRIDYLVRHEAAGELYAEMRALNQRANAVINLPRDRARVHVGPCPEVEPDEDGEMVPCLGEITAYFPSDPELRPAMMCRHEGCTHGEKTWPQWARLGTRILERKGVAVTWDQQSMQRMAESM